jgi:hypothetical protein
MFKKGDIGQATERFLKGSQSTDVKRIGNLHTRHLIVPQPAEQQDKPKSSHLEKK